jgi:hypothetical protein
MSSKFFYGESVKTCSKHSESISGYFRQISRCLIKQINVIGISRP